MADERLQSDAGAPRLVDGCVADDLPCDQCGYNLYTLAEGGRCPECGYPIAETLRPDQLQYAPPAYVRALALSCRLLLWAALLFLVSALWLCIPAIAFFDLPTGWQGSQYDPDGIMGPLQFVAILLLLGGLLGLTRRDPRYRWRRERSSVRIILRRGLAAAVLWVVLIPAGLLLGHLNVLSFPIALLGYLGYVAGSTLLSMILLAIFVYYLRSLAQRLVSRPLQHRCENVLILHLMACVVIVVGVASTAGDAVVYTVITVELMAFSLLLWRFSSGLRAAAQAAQRHAASLAADAAGPPQPEIPSHHAIEPGGDRS